VLKHFPHNFPLFPDLVIWNSLSFSNNLPSLLLPLPLNHPQSLSHTHIILAGILVNTCSCSPSFCLSHLFCWGLEDLFLFITWVWPTSPTQFLHLCTSVFHDLLTLKKILSPCLPPARPIYMWITSHTHLSSSAHPFFCNMSKVYYECTFKKIWLGIVILHSQKKGTKKPSLGLYLFKG